MLYIKSIDINYDGLLPLSIVSYDRSGGIVAWDIFQAGNLVRSNDVILCVIQICYI